MVKGLKSVKQWLNQPGEQPINIAFVVSVLPVHLGPVQTHNSSCLMNICWMNKKVLRDVFSVSSNYGDSAHLENSQHWLGGTRSLCISDTYCEPDPKNAAANKMPNIRQLNEYVMWQCLCFCYKICMVIYAFSRVALFFILVLTLKPEFERYTEHVRESIMQEKNKKRKR